MASAAVYQSKAAKTEATIAKNATIVFAGYRTWRFAHRKSDNHPFFMMEGSPIRHKDGTEEIPTYYVDLHDCTCPSHRDGRVACKHMRAVRLWFEAVKRGELSVPRRMTAGDRRVLEADHAQNASIDVAEAADALLDAYHAQQATQRASRWAEPEQAWWETGIVWLKDGDRVAPDTVPTSVPPTCRQPGCDEPCVLQEPYCGRHVLVDAF
jgi:hypothetical protein